MISKNFLIVFCADLSEVTVDIVKVPSENIDKVSDYEKNEKNILLNTMTRKLFHVK